MEHKLATAEKRVLVELVRLVQKRGLQGESGGWKEFLDIYDKKIGSSLSDPSRRTSEVLVAFLSTFKKKEDLQLFAKVVQCNTNRALIEKFKEESPDNETPEQRLVRMTLEHPEYPVDFSFPSFAEGWFVTEIRRKKSTVVKSTKMIAIDCEMVLCEDGSEAVVRVGAVNRDLKVVLDKFVKPDQPIVDYRTDITGVTAADLENATLTVADIQKKLRRYLANGTSLVGHSLHNDLKVLKIDHTRVIDTSLVFKYIGTGKPRRPSLNNLCKSILGNEVRKDGDPHNCVHDASAAMKLVLAVVEKGVETLIQPSKEILESEKTKLLLHRIPHNVQSEELKGVISGEFSLDVMPSKRPGGFYSAIVVFNSPEEANQAFDNIKGDRLKDQKGLPQKLVGFKAKSGTEASLYVRKMVFDESMEVKPATKRSCPEDDDDDNNKVNAKKQKMEEDEVKEKTEQLKEIEELKLKLKSKDFQVQAQDKIIASLKKQLEKTKKKT